MPFGVNEAARQELVIFFFVAAQVVVAGGADEAAEVGKGLYGQFFFGFFEFRAVFKEQVL